jgi:hypothetical protein
MSKHTVNSGRRRTFGLRVASVAVVAAGLAASFGAGHAYASLSNGDFETGSLSGWTASGTTSTSATNYRSGLYAAQLGSTLPTKGASSIAQTFTVPAGATQASAWYLMTCNSRMDYLTISITDVSARRTTTLVSKICTKNYTWTQVTAPVTAGKDYTWTFTNYDDNKAGTATYTNVDDVTVA